MTQGGGADAGPGAQMQGAGGRGLQLEKKRTLRLTLGAREEDCGKWNPLTRVWGEGEVEDKRNK